MDVSEREETLWLRRVKSGDLLLWFALAIAFSPVLLDMAQHWLAEGWARYSLPFVVLLLICIADDAPQRPMRWPAAIMICTGLLSQLVAIVASVTFLARPGLALCVVGLILLRGTASPRVAVLALWFIPVPFFVMRESGGAAVAHELYEIATASIASLGGNVEIEGRRVVMESGHLTIRPQQAGLSLIMQGLGLAWYRGVRLKLDWLKTARSLAIHAAVAIPIQLLAISSALLVYTPLGETAANLVLEDGAWLLALTISLLVTERRRGAGANSSSMRRMAGT